MFNIDLVNESYTQYDMRRFINFDTDMYDILDSKFLYLLNKIDKFGIYTVTVEENKPSLIAERIYGAGNTQFWWIILYFNNIVDPNRIPAGTQLRYPSIEKLENIYFSLQSKRADT